MTCSVGTRQRPVVSVALALLFSGCEGEPPAVKLEPSPSTLVSAGDYRFTDLSLSATGAGLDLDDDGTIDNHFAYLLDLLYTQLEAIVISATEEALDDPEAAEAAWKALSLVLIQLGFPISAEAYDAIVQDAIRQAETNYIPALATSGDQVTATFFSGPVTPVGYRLEQELGALKGASPAQTTGVPRVTLGPGSLTLLYPGDLLELPMLESSIQTGWTGERLDDGVMGGGIPLEAVVDAVMALIPGTIEVNGVPVPIPTGEIESALTQFLATAETDDGELLFDLELETGEQAISAGFQFEGTAIQRAP